MSTADVQVRRPRSAAPVLASVAPSAPVSWLRLLRSELLPGVPAPPQPGPAGRGRGDPVIVGDRAAAGRAAGLQRGGGGNGPPFLDQVAGNGVFLAFLALTMMLTLVLPLVVSVVAGDSIAGEAGYGTLRYLLAVPAGRTRLLGVKYLSVVAFGLCAVLVISVVSLICGVAAVPGRTGDAAVRRHRVAGRRACCACCS